MNPGFLPLFDIQSARFVGTKLTVKFLDEKVYNVDLAAEIREHPKLKAILDRSVRAKMRVAEGGRSILCEGSPDLAISSRHLRIWGITQKGAADNAFFEQWMDRHGLNERGVTELLGVEWGTIRAIKERSLEVPPLLKFACIGYDVQQADLALRAGTHGKEAEAAGDPVSLQADPAPPAAPASAVDGHSAPPRGRRMRVGG